jgi:hypothetical protein
LGGQSVNLGRAILTGLGVSPWLVGLSRVTIERT